MGASLQNEGCSSSRSAPPRHIHNPQAIAALLRHPGIFRAAPGLASRCGGSARGDGRGPGSRAASGGVESPVEDLGLFASSGGMKGGALLLGISFVGREGELVEGYLPEGVGG